MRILQIIPSISLVYGGPSQMILGLSRSLSKAGAEVTVITTNTNGDVGQAPLDVPLGQAIAQDGYELYYFPCAPFRRYKFSLPLLTWLAQNAQHYDIAHIHALFSPLSTAAARTCRRQQLPYLLRPLGTLDPADLQKKRLLKSLYGQFLERPNLQGAAAVHFTTQQEAIVSHRFGAVTKDMVLPLGVELPPVPENLEALQASLRAEWGLPSDRPLLLFLSRLDPKKGLDLLLAASQRLQAEGKPFHLVLAGGNPQDPAYEAQIRQQVEQSPLKDCTTITGFVRGDRKRALLSLADCFVLPSAYENFGIAVAEAMAAGVPVVISKGVYIWQEIQAAQAGWVCETTAESLYGALVQALGSGSEGGSERRRRGQNAQDYAAQHYQWDAIAQSLLGIYRGLV